MPIICPTITAETPEQYATQLKKVAGFAQRIQIDLTDGQFAEHKTVEPAEVWWPAGVAADIHLMYIDPLSAVERLVEHSPNLIIVHAEADTDFKKITKLCHQAEVGLGIALLPDTSAEEARPLIEPAEHVLIFSGNLGYQGGSRADLELIKKIEFIKSRRPEIEIGWDGGINDQNVSILSAGGVDVLNVGGFIQNSPDPERTFKALQRIADETGTT